MENSTSKPIFGRETVNNLTMVRAAIDQAKSCKRSEELPDDLVNDKGIMVEELNSYMQLKERISSTLYGGKSYSDRDIAKLGSEFLKAAEQGSAHKLKVFINEDFPVIYQDQTTGETALHIAAACRARHALRVIMKDQGCDYSIRDNQGRLPSEMAYLHGQDPVLARLLCIKEKKQA